MVESRTFPTMQIKFTFELCTDRQDLIFQGETFEKDQFFSRGSFILKCGQQIMNKFGSLTASLSYCTEGCNFRFVHIWENRIKARYLRYHGFPRLAVLGRFLPVHHTSVIIDGEEQGSKFSNWIITGVGIIHNLCFPTLEKSTNSQAIKAL